MLKTVTNSINASQIQTPITLPGNVTLSTGNLVIGTSGKGIDFSATSHPAGMTSELLADYEEGTWTPTFLVGSGSVTTTTSNAVYTKVGRNVQCSFRIDVSAASSPSGSLQLSGLPFTSQSANTTGQVTFTLWIGLNTAQSYLSGYIPSNATFSNLTSGAGAVVTLNNTADASILKTGTILIGTVIYQSA